MDRHMERVEEVMWMGQANSCQRQAGRKNPFQNGSTSILPPLLLSLFLALCLFNGNLLNSFFSWVTFCFRFLH